ncbi:MAG TPA: MBL fold metallo-hydrolase RNA specificity domain-containing protein, partial [Patescibacteria group bacterium]|nr:MBL fold metallo-hydrolase RNA specificity domain-containing protein [Patescibacteria group bacterium]
AGSGMMSGGRILHHAVNYLGDPTTRVLFVGYQSEETLGRKISEGVHMVTIENQHITIKASINKIESLSSHADQPKLLNWLGHIKGTQEVFLTHGEEQDREVLKDAIKKTLMLGDIFLPHNGDEHTLS